MEWTGENARMLCKFFAAVKEVEHGVEGGRGLVMFRIVCSIAGQCLAQLGNLAIFLAMLSADYVTSPDAYSTRSRGEWGMCEYRVLPEFLPIRFDLLMPFVQPSQEFEFPTLFFTSLPSHVATSLVLVASDYRPERVVGLWKELMLDTYVLLKYSMSIEGMSKFLVDKNRNFRQLGIDVFLLLLDEYSQDSSPELYKERACLCKKAFEHEDKMYRVCFCKACVDQDTLRSPEGVLNKLMRALIDRGVCVYQDGCSWEY